MGSRFVRKVRTASGAVEVQIVEKSGRQVVDVEHVGSAHSNADIALLLAAGQERLMPGQGTFDLEFVEQIPVSLADVAYWTEQQAKPIPEQTSPVGRPARNVSAEGNSVGPLLLSCGMFWSVRIPDLASMSWMMRAFERWS